MTSAYIKSTQIYIAKLQPNVMLVDSPSKKSLELSLKQNKVFVSLHMGGVIEI